MRFTVATCTAGVPEDPIIHPSAHFNSARGIQNVRIEKAGSLMESSRGTRIRRLFARRCRPTKVTERDRVLHRGSTGTPNRAGCPLRHGSATIIRAPTIRIDSYPGSRRRTSLSSAEKGIRRVFGSTANRLDNLVYPDWRGVVVRSRPDSPPHQACSLHSGWHRPDWTRVLPAGRGPGACP